MNELSEEIKKKLASILDEFLLDTHLKASKITLFSLMSNKSLAMELFSQNIEEFIYFSVAQRVTTSFSSRLKKAVIQFSEILIKAQEGSVINNPEPYDLKFKLKNDEEYWIDIKFINDQKSYATTNIDRKIKAESNGKIYKLCLYDVDNQSEDDYLLNCNDFWALMAGFKNAKVEIFNLIHGAANALSISSIIKETQQRLIREWRNQD